VKRTPKRPRVRKKVAARKKRKTLRRTAPTLRRATPGAPPALRWNPDPEDVQRSVVQLVLSLIEFIRKLMERQAVRRLEENTLTPEEVEKVGLALMKLEETIHQIARRFGLDPRELNLDLGPLGRLH
jgi:hypothetical protein